MDGEEHSLVDELRQPASSFWSHTRADRDLAGHLSAKEPDRPEPAEEPMAKPMLLALVLIEQMRWRDPLDEVEVAAVAVAATDSQAARDEERLHHSPGC